MEERLRHPKFPREINNAPRELSALSRVAEKRLAHNPGYASLRGKGRKLSNRPSIDSQNQGFSLHLFSTENLSHDATIQASPSASGLAMEASMSSPAN